MTSGRTRILHVATRFLAAGSEREVADIVEALPGDCYEHVLVVGAEHQSAHVRALCGDLELVVVPWLVRRPDPSRDALALAEIVRILRRYRPTILHTIQSKSGILGRLAARITGVPKVVHTVAMANFGPGFNPVMSALYRTSEIVAANWTDQFLVPGTELRDRFITAGVGRSDQYQVIRSAVDVEPFRRAVTSGRSAARAALGLPTTGPIVLFAGSLDQRKGAFGLPQYFACVKERTRGAHLVVAGDGPARGYLMTEFARLGLGADVTLLGFTTRLPEAMAAADCLIALSRAEGLATVLVLAAAAGTPFVSYDVDGPRELISLGATGDVVALGAWREAARSTCASVSRGPAAPVDLTAWSPATVHAQYLAVFENLRTSPKPP